jgi:hypothetical protein
MRDDHRCVLYDQSGRVKYHPQDGLQDGQTKEGTSKFSTISDYANGHQHSSDPSVNKNKNYPPASTGLYTWG